MSCLLLCIPGAVRAQYVVKFTARVTAYPSFDNDYWINGQAFGDDWTNLAGAVDTSWTYTALNSNNTTSGASLTNFSGGAPMSGDPNFQGVSLIGQVTGGNLSISSNFSVTASSTPTNDSPSFFFSGGYSGSGYATAPSGFAWSGARFPVSRSMLHWRK